MLKAIAGANDHKGSDGPTSRNMQSCENLKISFKKFFRQDERYFLGAAVLAEIFQVFLQMMPGKQLANEVRMVRVL